MSEVKGTLLAIVLAISVFTLVFGIVVSAVKRASNTISGRIDETAELQPDINSQSVSAYTLTY